MPRFCTRCGAPNADDAKFCDACGNPLPPRPAVAAAAATIAEPAVPPAPITPPAAAFSARPPRAGGAGSRRPLLWGAGAGALVLLLIVAGAVWWLLGRSEGPSPEQANAIAQSWLQQAQPELMQKACLRNFNYSANPVFVNGFDTRTQAWLNTLVKAGIYTAGQPVQNGFAQQIRYAYGPNAPTYIRKGALCVASGITVADAQVLSRKDVQAAVAAKLPQLKDGLPSDWAVVGVRWQWKDLAPWASEPAAVAQFGNLQPQQTFVLVHKGSQGWALGSPDELAALRGQLMAAVQGGQSGTFGFPMAGNPAVSRAAAPSGDSGGGFLGWVKGLFGGGSDGGTAEVSERYIRDIANGKFDDAYALLAPNMQAMGRGVMQFAFATAQAEMQRRGGISSIEVVRSRDTEAGRRLVVQIRYNNGAVDNTDMVLAQSDGRWRIVKSD